jgi:glucose-6-phosphate dehydrogenase assembly protein OpcA
MQVPEYDETTYWGRFEAFRAMANPIRAFHTNSQIRQMQSLLLIQRAREDSQLAKIGSPEISMTLEEIKAVRKAQSVVATAVHPDTGEFIAWPMRFSSFIPMNLPIAFGLLFTAPTPMNTIFW